MRPSLACSKAKAKFISRYKSKALTVVRDGLAEPYIICCHSLPSNPMLFFLLKQVKSSCLRTFIPAVPVPGRHICQTLIWLVFFPFSSLIKNRLLIGFS